MYDFIKETPKHRDNPPIYASYSQYRDILLVDFKKRCAYCNDNHNYRIRSFAIDHFVPCTPKNFVPTIPKNRYDNLIYSCSYCNRAKWDKWPTNDENIPNQNNKGFVDPTLEIYDTHLYRTNSGSISWLTPLGKWMVEIGFKFDERDYCVKLLWNLNELRKSIEILISESKKYPPQSQQHNQIKSRATDFALEYFLFHNELMEYYKS